MDCCPSGPLTMGFPRDEHWSGLPFASLGDLLDPGIKAKSPTLAGRFFTTKPPEKPVFRFVYFIFSLKIRLNRSKRWRRQWHPTPSLLPGKSHGRRAWWAAAHGAAKIRHDWATSLSLFTYMHWRRKWQPTPVFLPGESQGRGSLVGCHLWGRTESDTTEAT